MIRSGIMASKRADSEDQGRAELNAEIRDFSRRPSNRNADGMSRETAARAARPAGSAEAEGQGSRRRVGSATNSVWQDVRYASEPPQITRLARWPC